MKHAPKKHLGQHFLKHTQVVTDLLQDLSPQKNEIFIEIGPGLGALTLPLLSYQVPVYGVEFDRDVMPRLLEKTKAFPLFQCIAADATCFDYASIIQKHTQPLRVIGNLPYNVSTPIMFQLWKYIDHWQDMTFMLQKEVVERMIAPPGNSDYGRLAMMTQYFCNVQGLEIVPPEAFDPPPKVDSQFVHLIPRTREERNQIDPDVLSVWVKRLFQFPRKTVLNNLKAHCSLEQLEQAGINPKDRPQEISLAQLVRLASL